MLSLYEKVLIEAETFECSKEQKLVYIATQLTYSDELTLVTNLEKFFATLPENMLIEEIDYQSQFETLMYYMVEEFITYSSTPDLITPLITFLLEKDCAVGNTLELLENARQK